MKKALVILVLLFLFSNPLKADVIYSNLGPGDTFSTTLGYSIGYPFKEDEAGQASAYSFVPESNFQLMSVDLAIAVNTPGSGSSNFIVAIYDDFGGKPDSALTSAIA